MTDLASIFLHTDQTHFSNPPNLWESACTSPLPSHEKTLDRIGTCLLEPLMCSNDLLVNDRVQLTSAEIPIFRNYVETVSRWIDSFSRDQPFYSAVPLMALNCPVLMYSCLALSAKHSALKAPADEERKCDNVAIFYHQKAVKALSTLLADSEWASNDAILASSIILSTYEMLDVAGESFGSHLKGVAFFLQSQGVNGDSCSIKGAAYWTWFRHEIWAALQTGRRMFLDDKYWQPKVVENFEGLSVEDIANRAIFVFGQCVSFFNDDTIGEGLDADEKRKAQRTRATELDTALETWKEKLPLSTAYFLFDESPPTERSASYRFPSQWFIYPQSAIALQVYHASKILLNLHYPPETVENACMGRFQHIDTRRCIERSREAIFQISNAGISDTWSLLSTQCLYVAGLVTNGVLERKRTLELIERCQESSGRRTKSLADTLRELWAQ
ncbi:fungal-specific transcription factor domain-containing protein [Aspergillus heterothallicus]